MSDNFAFCEICNKKVLITGYRGFIGSNFLEGRKYFMTSTPKNADICIHLACKVDKNDFETFQKNILYDKEIFSTCKEYGIKLIYISTNNVYPLIENCTEETPYSTSDFYSLAKITSELNLKSDSSLKYIILRLSDVFGKNQRHGNLFHAIQKSIETLSPLKLYGQGTKIRSYIYIKELINILEYFILNENIFNNEIFNIAYPKSMSVKEIIYSISDFSGIKVENVAYSNPSDTRTMSVKKLENTGYKFNYNLLTALEEYINEIKN